MIGVGLYGLLGSAHTSSAVDRQMAALQKQKAGAIIGCRAWSDEVVSWYDQQLCTQKSFIRERPKPSIDKGDPMIDVLQYETDNWLEGVLE